MRHDDPGEVWHALDRAVALNNDARADREGTNRGDPTEVALIEAMREAGLSRAALEEQWVRTADIAFDAVRRRMTTLHQGPDHGLAIVKGAPEAVLPLCRNHRGRGGTPAPVDRHAALRLAEEAAESGFRVLAFAERKLSSLPERPSPEDVERDLTFLGLAALADPPRPGVDEAIAACVSAGITVAMITGDHPATVKAIAVRLGIVEDDGAVITGAELRELSDQRGGGRQHPRLRQGLAGAEIRHRHGPAAAGAVCRHDRRRGQRCAGPETGRHRGGHGAEGHRRRSRGSGHRAAR